MRKLALLMSLMLCLGFEAVFAQTRNISGTVIGIDDGLPIPGVSIVVKGTTIGTITRGDGAYDLAVPNDAQVLVYSFVGMKAKEVLLDGKSKIDVTLETESFDMDEVVVTAMGISREKKALGYAVQNVDGDKLTQAGNTNVSTALQGKVSGVEVSSSSGMPGSSSRITIRGARSFTGDNTPLYIIDGTPIASTADVSTLNSVTGADFANRAIDIDPNDIESINILKGQAASAIYGMRASNGVIVITTKSGKGIAKGKPQITYNSNVAFDVISTMPDLQKQFAQGSKGKYDPTSSMSWGPVIAELANDAQYGGNTDNAYTQEDGLHQGQYYVPQRAKAGLDPWATPSVYDNAEDFFETGLTWSNSLNIAQAFDKSNFS